MGPNYRQTGRKEPSAPALLRLLHLDMYKTPLRVSSIGKYVDKLSTQQKHVPSCPQAHESSAAKSNRALPSLRRPNRPSTHTHAITHIKNSHPPPLPARALGRPDPATGRRRPPHFCRQLPAALRTTGMFILMIEGDEGEG